MTDTTSTPSFDSQAIPAGGKHVDDAASALKTSVTADVHDLADKAKEVGGGMLDHAREAAQAQITGGKDRVAEGLTSFADAIRQTSDNLRTQEKSSLTEYVARAADQVEAASDYLQGQSLSAVLSDIGGFARREPAIFLGSAFALGVLGGRFLKSSKAPNPETAALDTQSSGSLNVQGVGSGSTQSRQRSQAPRPASKSSGSPARRPAGAGKSEASDSAAHGNGGSQAKLPGAL